MSDSSAITEIESVGQFLDEFYPHFAIMGIFGTVATFMNQGISNGETETISLGGLLAVLAIFSYTAAWIGWRALTELLTGIHEAERHLFTELGYTLIILSTFTIAFTIGNQIISSFEVIQNIAIIVAAASIGIIIYTRNYPLERYEIGELRAADIAFISFFLLLSITSVFSNGIATVLNRNVSTFWIRESLTMFIFGSIHMTMSENIVAFGVIRSINFEELTIDLVKDADIFQWPFSISTLVGSGTILAIYAGFHILADKSPENQTFLIWGMQWEIAITYHFLIFITIVSLAIWFQPWTQSKREKIARNASVALLLFAIFELLLAYAGILTTTHS